MEESKINCLEIIRAAGDEMEINDYIISYTEQNGNIDGSLERAFRYEVSSANGGLDEETMDQVIAYVNSEIEEGRAAWLREQLGLGFDPSLDMF
ncbi:MAG: hypothetical protein COA45_02285 [Zetaproteobacteria bacterium]|nr:MAG: hypothetical protein COA45_02285 [Zetaproteobacteria bacterium]